MHLHSDFMSYVKAETIKFAWLWGVAGFGRRCGQKLAKVSIL